MALESMQDLLVEQLRELHHGESRISRMLPRVVRLAGHESLGHVLRTYQANTERHEARLIAIFEYLGLSPAGGESLAVAGQLEEIDDTLRQEGPDEMVDAALIIHLRGLTHIGIAGYTTTIALAEALGEPPVITLLQMTLDEELELEEALSTIARNDVNPDAVMAGIPEQARSLGAGLNWTDF